MSDQRPSTKPAHYLLGSAVALVLSLAALEAMSALYFTFFSEHFHRPAYLQNDSVARWQTEFEPWGAWHKPNASARQEGPCFDVTYTSNSIGARDIERPIPGPGNSAIFLGDSFIEGFGIKDEDRLSNLFEREAHKPSINLAASASLGPLQYLMLYKSLGSRFAHDTVVIGFLPDNDFTDNDPEFPYWKEYGRGRHRPYYKKTDAGYETFYTAPSVTGRTMFDVISERPLPRWYNIMRQTWTGGFYFAKQGWLQARSIDIDRDVSGNGYFEQSPERLNAAYYFFDKIIEQAAGKNVVILVIPTYAEIKALRTRQSPWLEDFKQRFSRARVTVIDLAPLFLSLSDADLRSAFLQCDGHWSEKGNRLAVDAVAGVGVTVTTPAILPENSTGWLPRTR
jgi:SGNH hydrolase-like domain, acetyltransferase AlgX